MQITLGMNITFIMLSVEICPPIHSMVVVTSPMGVHAPPALAAITIIPAKNNRMSLFGINLRIKDTITMEVVRLSSTDERKKVTQHIIHKSDFRIFGFDPIGNKTKTMVSIHQFHNGHCAHEEK